MISELEKLRGELYNALQSGQRTNRRAILQAFKLVSKACNVLKVPKLERKPFRSAEQEITYPPTTEQPERREVSSSDIIATNVPNERPGRERPKASGRKPKATRP